MMAGNERTASVYPSSESETDNGSTPVARQAKNNTPSNTDLGKRVLFTSNNEKKHGTLRYWGKPEFSKDRVWCGVELDEPKGKNNGSVQGIRYFSCPEACGIFVQLNKVQLDLIGESRAKAKSSVLSLVEKKARKSGLSSGKSTSPFFYNTIPRSSSIPALNQGMGGSGFEKPLFKLSPEHSRSPGIASRKDELPLPSNRRPSKSSPLKKYTTEHDVSQRTNSSEITTRLQPSSALVVRSRQARRPLGSCSEVSLSHNGGGGGTISSGIMNSRSNNRNSYTGSIGMRSSVSCQNLSSNYVPTKTQMYPKRFLRRPSPQISPPVDSEDSFSYYSSASDLSHGESDTDLTPRSSSTSPCFIDVDTTSINDVPLIFKPTSPSRNRDCKSTSKSPTHRANIPTGLATPTSTLIESSRLTGGNEDCRVPSPEHQKNSKVYLNTKNSRPTLEHPLVNGHAAAATNAHDNNKENRRINDVFVCPSSGQEMTMSQQLANGGNGVIAFSENRCIQKLQEDLSSCLKQQVAMEARMCRMEESLLQFQSVFIKTMEQVQDTLKKQMEFNQKYRSE